MDFLKRASWILLVILWTNWIEELLIVHAADARPGNKSSLRKKSGLTPQGTSKVSSESSKRESNSAGEEAINSQSGGDLQQPAVSEGGAKEEVLLLKVRERQEPEDRDRSPDQLHHQEGHRGKHREDRQGELETEPGGSQLGPRLRDALRDDHPAILCDGELYGVVPELGFEGRPKEPNSGPKTIRLLHGEQGPAGCIL
ncbi:hypothetical protein OJ252_2770 [Cryptosporidium canis]|uniref:Signal peptide-containing protein n=1 Tax=Cryptosporidium canis TaxID=195482 RepID=A0ABQ8P4K9_9CRYT|nr:hypothetical protein OJ252_2770 [Cryptosporidium canis]